MVRRKAGFTVSEAIVACAVLLVVVGLCLGVWSGLGKGVRKGEATLTTAQEAALVVARVRRDLLCLALPAEGAVSVGGQKAGSVRLNARTRRLERVSTTSALAPVGARGGWSLSFPVSVGSAGRTERVTYAFVSQEGALTRAAGGKRKRLGASRLRALSISLWCETEGGSEPVPVFDASTRLDEPVRQVWFVVKIEAGTKSTDRGTKPAGVSLETRVFPKHANRQLRAAWLGKRDL